MHSHDDYQASKAKSDLRGAFFQRTMAMMIPTIQVITEVSW